MLKQLTKYDYREQFCKALRSGKYTQGHDRFITATWLGFGPTRYCAAQVAEAAGICHRADIGGKIGVNNGWLYHLNDGKKMTFAEIADWIEAQP